MPNITHDSETLTQPRTLTLVDLCKFCVISFGSILLSFYSIVEVLDYIFEEEFFLSALSPLTKFLVFVSVAIVVDLIMLCVYIWKAYTKQVSFSTASSATSSDNGDSLLGILEQAYNSKRWNEVVKIGRPISESLWYTGKYDLRAKIGEMIASAAGLCGEFEIQAETLLDDLGWTRIRLNETDAGIKSIELGLKVAKDHNLFYLIAKGYRHLADINLAKACNFWTLRYMDYGNQHLPKTITKVKYLEDCYALYSKAISILPSITNERKRIEMEGNLKYTLAKYYLIKREFDKALTAVSDSQTLYKSLSDKDREVKLFNLRGKIYMEMGQEENAITAYQEGLRKATDISNNAHMVSNSISLTEYYLDQGQRKLAKQMLTVARDNSFAISDPILSARIKELRDMLEE